MTVIYVRKVFDVSNSVTSLLLSVTFSYQHCQISQQIRRMTSTNRILTLENLNPNVIAMEYAVRGPLVSRALDIEKELDKVKFFFLFFIK